MLGRWHAVIKEGREWIRREEALGLRDVPSLIGQNPIRLFQGHVVQPPHQPQSGNQGNPQSKGLRPPLALKNIHKSTLLLVAPLITLNTGGTHERNPNH